MGRRGEDARAGVMRIQGLGYIGFHAPDLSAWKPFAEQTLGFAPAAGPGGDDVRGEDASAGAGGASLFYRLDERRWRIAIHRSATPGLAYVGWELTDAAALAQASEHLAACGVAVDRSIDPAMRGVAGVLRFVDPSGNPHELFHGAATAPGEPFVSPAGVSGFVTRNGMGHVLIVVPDAPAAEAWYARVLGLRTTDRMDMGLGKRAIFMRTNARHHALAVTDVLPEPCFHHLMVEAQTLEDVGVAWDRAQKQNAPVMMTIGQHANDPMLSFYLTCPSGCGIEFGAGGTLVDDARWQIREVGPDELWGHRGPTMDQIEAGGGRA
ncbi:MAG: VOC family protein [Deltaproteobacteria bacterium]|nr:VOC family protein [Deltaproteobacteria bacterium]